MLIHDSLIVRDYFEKASKDEKKGLVSIEKGMKEYEELKPWSLLSTLHDFTHELIGHHTNNAFVNNLGPNNNQEMLKFSINGPKILLPQLLL